MKFLTKKEINNFCDFAASKNQSAEYWEQAVEAYKKTYPFDPAVLNGERLAAFVQTNLFFQYFSKQE